jgi:hypothetical protein
MIARAYRNKPLTDVQKAQYDAGWLDVRWLQHEARFKFVALICDISSATGG